MKDLKVFPEESEEALRQNRLEFNKVRDKLSPSWFFLAPYMLFESFLHNFPLVAKIILLGLSIYFLPGWLKHRRRYQELDLGFKKVGLAEVSFESFEIFKESHSLVRKNQNLPVALVGIPRDVNARIESKQRKIVVSKRLLEILNPTELRFVFCQSIAKLGYKYISRTRAILGLIILGFSVFAILFWALNHRLFVAPESYSNWSALFGLICLIVAVWMISPNEQKINLHCDIVALEATNDFNSAERAIRKIVLNTDQVIPKNLFVGYQNEHERIENLRAHAMKMGLTVEPIQAPKYKSVYQQGFYP